MTGYYEDEDKITYDEAHALVVDYIEKYRDAKSRVSTKDIARKAGVEESQHNLIRIHDALEELLGESATTGGRATQFVLDNDALRTSGSNSTETAGRPKSETGASNRKRGRSDSQSSGEG